MLHKAWNSKGAVPYCFPRSSIKFQGHTGQNITDFDPNWAFPDYRPVAAFKSLRFALFQGHPSNFKVTRLKKIVDFDPNWSFPGCNSNLNLLMVMKWYKKLEAAWKRCPIVFQGHPSKLKFTRLKNHRLWPELGVSGLVLQFEFTNGFEMVHTAWLSKEEVSYCFSMSSVKFQGHTRQKIADFDPNWAFPDCNSSLNSPMALKRLMHKAWRSIEEVPYSFPRSYMTFQGHTGQKFTILTRIEGFRTVTPVWIHWWIWTYAQSLM